MLWPYIIMLLFLRRDPERSQVPTLTHTAGQVLKVLHLYYICFRPWRALRWRNLVAVSCRSHGIRLPSLCVPSSVPRRRSASVPTVTFMEPSMPRSLPLAAARTPFPALGLGWLLTATDANIACVGLQQRLQPKRTKLGFAGQGRRPGGKGTLTVDVIHAENT
jgi:hypothetical protein